MKNKLIFALFFLLLAPFLSAEIIVTQQPNAIYNYGDAIQIPMIVKSNTQIAGTFNTDLICNGISGNFYKNGLFLNAGEEKNIDAVVILDRQIIGNASVFCIVRAYFASDSVLTNEFKVSDKINIELLTNKTDFNPQENIIIEGKATRENGIQANGFIDMIFLPENASQNMTYSNTVNNGFFSFNFILPKETKAGKYLLKLSAYEKDFSGALTNFGNLDADIRINQVPTSLEILFDENEVEPGTSINVRAILRDQTGKKVSSSAIISLKDTYNELRAQTEKPTDELWEFPVVYNEKPGTWTAVAISEAITSELKFEIKQKEIAEINIINNTLIITNKGNVPYNNSLLVKIGHETVELKVLLKIDETRRYTLNAPDGEYYIEVIHDGETKISETSFLTGKAIGVREASAVLALTRYPLAWIFVILVLGFVFAMILRKGYKGSFIGYMTSPRKDNIANPINVENELPFLRKRGITLKSKNKAEISLSLKGEKQGTSLVMLRIKNPGDVTNFPAAEQVLQEIINFAEGNKAIVYLSENTLSSILFILAPVMTKTYQNEKNAIAIAQKFREILERYNKIAKQKIDFGISLSYGDMVLKKEGSLLKFMSFGNILNVLKKIASLANSEVLLAEDIKNRILKDMSVEKLTRSGIDVYTLKEPRFKGDASKFINDFVRRMKKEERF
ncbi:hypothetical protein HYT25_01175 [Candidatus Pacearchaeota archaeon]|nr:hypothetical protein [Candidatus Pacearchaeota archaeon]